MRLKIAFVLKNPHDNSDTPRGFMKQSCQIDLENNRENYQLQQKTKASSNRQMVDFGLQYGLSRLPEKITVLHQRYQPVFLTDAALHNPAPGRGYLAEITLAARFKNSLLSTSFRPLG